MLIAKDVMAVMLMLVMLEAILIFILSYICHLLIFLLQVYMLEDEVRQVSLICSSINAKPM